MNVTPGNEQREHHRIAPTLSWKSKSKALAEAASAAALHLPGVLGAAFTISGPPAELILHVDCRLRANQDPAATMKLIADSVVEDLERAIGIQFLERHLDFRIAESFPHEAPAASALPKERITQGGPQLSVAS
ncbi:hypothetical protein NCCP1664_17520 [Zafaria cholistanensis]|uniref:Uncharacterized protein n=1 Tax=Zafaria cholistanensis TaxID=1682741 RepID=A0A5A7NRR5_9MICC|nr:hypothetical protein [Zafaria cholistanensis]GER23256.1 hypothetical protein NCCP1664_17520 [Zafaria cholistanensis]